MKPFDYEKIKKLISNISVLEYLYENNYKDFETNEDCCKAIYDTIIGNQFYEPQYNKLFDLGE